MADRKATAIWEGTLKEGKGSMQFANYDGSFSFSSRFEDGAGTNPEELLGAAHAGCFSMDLSSRLAKAGFPAKRIETTAHIALRNIDGAPTITTSHLVTKADVPGISEEEFQKLALQASHGCPVSRSLMGIDITHDATLI